MSRALRTLAGAAGLLLACALVLGCRPAEAGKLVGVVFDDSGSMAPSYNLPLLGLQMLAGTLDGGQGRDRLIVTKFGWHLNTVRGPRRGGIVAPNVLEVPLAPQAELQATIDDFARWPILADTDTPYRPVGDMLETLAAQVEPGQDAHLVVLTDGAFDVSGLGTPEALRRQFEAIRARIAAKRARLEIHFLLVLKEDAKTVADAVKAQPVRAELLRTFNGAEDAGSYQVDGFADLRSKMLDVIARISETDARRSAAVVGRSGGDLTLTLPFAVSRIIALTTGRGSSPETFPSPVRIQGVEALRVETTGRMAKTDRLRAWEAEGILSFRATQFTPHPFLQPGRHVLAFDKPPGDDLVLLFRTDLSVAWNLRDGDRTVAESRQAGKVAVPAGRDLTLDVSVRDRLAGDTIANLRDFPKDAAFEATIVGPDGKKQTVPLVLDRDRATVRGPVRFPGQGVFRLEVEMRVAGAPSKSSGAFEVDARARSEFAMTVDPGTGDGQRFAVETMAGPVRGDPRITTVTVTPHGPPEGVARVGVRELPPGVEAVHEGTPLPAEGAHVPYRDGRPIRIELRRTGAWTGHVGGSPVSAAVAIEVDDEGAGGGSLHGVVTVGARIPAARLTYRGHGEQPGGGTPMPVPIKDLPDARRAFDFVLDGAILPPSHGDFAVTLSDGIGRWVSARAEVAAGAAGEPVAIRVPLGTWYPVCCFLGLWQGRYDATLAYRPASGVQNAAETAAFDLDDAGGGSVGACLALLGLLLLLIWLAGWIAFVASAYRFPKNAVLMIERAGAFPESRRLAYVNFTTVKAMLWPARLLMWRWRPPRIREERVREGLRLIARPGGVDALPAGAAWPPLKLEQTGSLLDAESPMEPGRRPNPIVLNWGSVLTNRQQRSVIGLWERRGDFQPRQSRTRL